MAARKTIPLRKVPGGDAIPRNAAQKAAAEKANAVTNRPKARVAMRAKGKKGGSKG